MHEEHNKSLGGALVDVFDAGVTLVKTEIRAVGRQVGQVAKAKGLGLVLLLGAVGPLLMGLIFLILAVFYLLMRLGLGAWAAALIIALVGFALAGALVVMGIKKLSAEVPNDQPRRPQGPMTEDERLEAQYQAEQAAKARAASMSATSAHGPVAVSTGPATQSGHAERPGTVVTGGPSRVVVTSGSVAGGAVQGGAAQGSSSGRYPITPDERDNIASSGPFHSGTRASAESIAMGADVARGTVRPGVSTSGFTAGEAGVNVRDQGRGLQDTLTSREGVPSGTEMRGTDAGQVRLPVYEATENGEPQVYGSGLNKKLDGSDTHSAGHGGHGGHDKKHDPNIQHPVVLTDEPGISVSTTPTFREDMKKEGY